MNENPDLQFPSCCSNCPHRQPVTAACSHELSQSLIHEAEELRTCPVYRREKTAAMRDLSRSLQLD